jgi:hypothetical protein
MTDYVPALLWFFSALACMFIAKRRHVETTPVRAGLVALFGPVAIAFVLMAKPERLQSA